MPYVNLIYEDTGIKTHMISSLINLFDEAQTHCLGMNYYVNFLGGIGSNGFHIKLIFGTQDN